MQLGVKCPFTELLRHVEDPAGQAFSVCCNHHCCKTYRMPSTLFDSCCSMVVVHGGFAVCDTNSLPGGFTLHFLGNQIYSFFPGSCLSRVPKDVIEDLRTSNSPDKIVPDDLGAVVICVLCTGPGRLCIRVML